LPVSSLEVKYIANQLPIVSWSYNSQSIAGCDLYIGSNKINTSLLTNFFYEDIGYSKEERIYEIKPIDNNDQEGPGRTIQLPLMQSRIVNDEIIYRGIMNRLNYVVENQSNYTVENVSILNTINGHSHRSEPFSIDSQATLTIPVTVGGYAELVMIILLVLFCVRINSEIKLPE
jgi:hypothetical protein